MIGSRPVPSRNSSRPPNGRCGTRADIGVLRWVDFEDGNRGLYLLAVIGTDASDEDVATAARILDSLVVEAP